MIIVQSKEIYTKKISGVWFLLEPNKKFMRELNDVAGFIWGSLEKPTSVVRLVGLVCKRYKVTRAVAEKDIKMFIQDYLKDGYIIEK